MIPVPRVCQEALVEAAVGEEKRRILEQREEMEKSVDEIREGHIKREAGLQVMRRFFLFL